MRKEEREATTDGRMMCPPPPALSAEAVPDRRWKIKCMMRNDRDRAHRIITYRKSSRDGGSPWWRQLEELYDDVRLRSELLLR